LAINDEKRKLDFCPYSAIIQQETCGRGGMADAPDLGSGAARCGGSSPLARTNPIFGKKGVGRYLFAFTELLAELLQPMNGDLGPGRTLFPGTVVVGLSVE
jgi:hypothetical protein